MRTRTRITLLCALALVVLAAGAAAAAPSFLGHTGLVVIPTADSLNRNDYNAAAYAINVEEGVDSTVFAANMGVAPNLEVGFARLRPEGGSGDTWINAKYAFAAETSAHPAVAFGVVDFTNETDTTAYAVLSKSFERGYRTSLGEITSPRFHIGVGGGMFDGVFGGLSATLGERFTVMVEYDSSDLNWGARLALTRELRAHFGAFDGIDDIGLGISFNKSL